MGPIGIMLTRSSMSGMAAKQPNPYDEDRLNAAISRVRSAIQGSSKGYLLGTFSYRAEPVKPSRERALPTYQE